MAYLDQITYTPYLKWRIHSKCSDVSRKLPVHIMDVVRYSGAYLEVNTHLYSKSVIEKKPDNVFTMYMFCTGADFICSAGATRNRQF